MPGGKQPVYLPPDWLDREDRELAPYAMRTRQSRGRRYAEDTHPFRTLYQRDRDRIVHCTAFRRLMYKTQVLATPTNDHHRTRLTHTLEVAQISRTIARQLGLNEDLTEAIALTHDLGHPAFGHAGEDALNQCMAAHGGFEHNRHGLRIVEVLEYRYADHPGLNLTWEVLESFASHGHQADFQELGRHSQPLLEAQVVEVTDSLAYDTHDIDDALSVGLISFDDLRDVEFWRRTLERVQKRHAAIGTDQLQPTVIRAMIDWLVTDLLTHTRQQLGNECISSIDDVRRASQVLVGSSPEVQGLKSQLEEFLSQKVYSHYKILRMAAKGRRLLRTLFQEYLRVPAQLPTRYARRIDANGPERTVCDYLAGMTDRYAQEEYLRLFQPFHGV
jgi:dGTPase